MENKASDSNSLAPALNATKETAPSLPLTVLQVIPRLEEGGAERGTIEITEALSREGARALVATAGGRLAAAVGHFGGRIIHLPVDKKNPLTILANGIRLARLIEREGVSIIHARSRAPAWSALLASRLSGVPLVTTYHGLYRAKGPFKRWYNSVMTRGERVIANSAHIATEIRSRYPASASRLIVIPRGVDLALFDPETLPPARVTRLRETWRLPEEARVVLLPGRLSRWKGQDLFIEAAALLAHDAELADGVFVLAGEAESARLRTELTTLAARTGLGKRILFVGHCNDMPAAYAASRVVVSASREPEAFGRVLIEAQAMGAIVVAADHGGAQETVRTGAEATGFRVTPGDARALAQGIAMALALAREEREAVSRRARAHVRESFSTARMCRDTLSVYRALLRGAVSPPQTRIAVIKLGALGDFVQALSPFRTIRAHHKDAHITLITTPPFAALARATGYFDEIWEDGRPRAVGPYCALVRCIRRARFTRVYDLQTSTRSSIYFYLLYPRLPEWSGVAPGCSHPHRNPKRVAMHTIERQAEQLSMAGIAPMLPAEFGWARADLSRFSIPRPFALLVPGGSSHRPRKRWPVERYAELAQALASRGLLPVVLGAAEEEKLAATIKTACPQALDLTGRTSFQDVIALGREAALAVGNDTGPMHLLAAAGTPLLVLFSAESDPARCAPRGARVRTLRRPNLADLPVVAVLTEAEALKALCHD